MQSVINEVACCCCYWLLVAALGVITSQAKNGQTSEKIITYEASIVVVAAEIKCKFCLIKKYV